MSPCAVRLADQLKNLSFAGYLSVYRTARGPEVFGTRCSVISSVSAGVHSAFSVFHGLSQTGAPFCRCFDFFAKVEGFSYGAI